LIRAISGRLRLDMGSVLVAGGDPRTDSLVRRALGLVPQEIALYHDLSVRENLVLLGQLAGLDRRTARAAVNPALDWIGLADRARSKVATLSGGQKRRLNLAAATLHQPRVLLLDEPTVGIDPPARERIHRMLDELRHRDMAILLATHDLDQAAELCDRIGFIVEGLIRAEGTLDELVRAAFGDGRALHVTLSHPPDLVGRGALEALGLESGDDARRWSGPVTGGLDTVPQFGRRLSEAGVDVVEVRVREPGLREVFFHIAGHEFDA
jgi:ABC-2 type transport system ATP-binding protein